MALLSSVPEKDQEAWGCEGRNQPLQLLFWMYGSAKPMQRYSGRGEADKGTESPKEVCMVLL